MSKEKKITLIESKEIKDKVKIGGKTLSFDKYKPGMVKGHVIVTAVDKNGNPVWVEERNNLVVIVGRSWLMQKAFNVDYPGQSVKHEFLTWFSIGSGGADSSDPFTPIAPNDSDVELFNRTQFGTDPALYADGGYKKAFTSLEYPDVTSAKLVLTVDYGEANGTLVNEIGLFASNSNDPAAATDFLLFSHATFPSHPKNSSVKFIIEWYFLF